MKARHCKHDNAETSSGRRPSKGFIDALLHQKNTNHRGKYRAGAIVDKGIDGGSDGRVYCNEVQQEGRQCEEIKQQNFFPRTFQRWPGIWVAGCQVGYKYSRGYGLSHRTIDK